MAVMCFASGLELCAEKCICVYGLSLFDTEDLEEVT
jgi:hypothetical protein